MTEPGNTIGCFQDYGDGALLHLDGAGRSAFVSWRDGLQQWALNFARRRMLPNVRVGLHADLASWVGEPAGRAGWERRVFSEAWPGEDLGDAVAQILCFTADQSGADEEAVMWRCYRLWSANPHQAILAARVGRSLGERLGPGHPTGDAWRQVRGRLIEPLVPLPSGLLDADREVVPNDLRWQAVAPPLRPRSKSKVVHVVALDGRAWQAAGRVLSRREFPLTAPWPSQPRVLWQQVAELITAFGSSPTAVQLMWSEVSLMEQIYLAQLCPRPLASSVQSVVADPRAGHATQPWVWLAAACTAEHQTQIVGDLAQEHCPVFYIMSARRSA